MEKVTFTVKGMTCMGCVGSVKKVLQPIPGVSGVEITLENGAVVISYDPAKAGVAQFRDTINDAGYEVEEVQ